MINAKELAKQLDRFLKSPICQRARVMVKLPQGEYRSPDGCVDIKSITLYYPISQMLTAGSISYGFDLHHFKQKAEDRTAHE